MNRDSVESRISETEAEANRLPPELHAMKAAMDMVFGAVTKPTERNYFAPGYDIEKAIMEMPGFLYCDAWQVVQALSARLQSRYEDRLDPKVEEALKQLDRALAAA